jgi:hypothetical protein
MRLPMKTRLTTTLIILLLAAGTSAQQPASQSAQQPQQSAPAGAPAPATEPPSADPINVRYQIAIRDSGGAKPGIKAVSMLATIHEVSSVRATGTAGTSRPLNPLNVDIVPTLVNEGRIRTRITIEYVPQSPGVQGAPPLSLRQTLHVWLTNGKPMVVSEATDPNSDRRLTVEVTATLLE